MNAAALATTARLGRECGSATKWPGRHVCTRAPTKGGYVVKVTVDNDRCTGHARCNAAAPDVFLLDDVGYCAIKGTIEVPVELETQAREGAAACPERAISISE